MAEKMRAAWRQAQNCLASGVNSPVRAFKAVGGEPIFMREGKGAYLKDAEGRRYVDLCLSWGALLMGHAYRPTVKAVQAQVARGTSFGTATEGETALAHEIQKAFPRMERMRFTSSGTEAVMSAIRLARGVTGKKRILKFEGCYHGHGDSLLVKAGSGLATFGSPDSAGVPPELAKLTSVLPYNDVRAAEAFFKRAGDLACVIVEPVAANMGIVPPSPGFLEVLRAGTKLTRSLLIFDEVITGYRLCYGGAQHVYGIDPDITVLGKIIGGGLPVGAFGGAKRLMDHLSPSGTVYQAGTLSGNPLSMAAGLSVLKNLRPSFYAKLNAHTEDLVERMEAAFEKAGQDVVINRQGSMFTPFFGAHPVRSWDDVRRTDKKCFVRYFRHMTGRGVYVPPSAFEASFLSAAHGRRELKKTLAALKGLS